MLSWVSSARRSLLRSWTSLLPVNTRLKEVVNTPMGMDVLVEVETKKGGLLNV